MRFSLKEIQYIFPEVILTENIIAKDFFNGTSDRQLLKGTSIWIMDIKDEYYVCVIKYGAYKLLIPHTVIDPMCMYKGFKKKSFFKTDQPDFKKYNGKAFEILGEKSVCIKEEVEAMFIIQFSREEQIEAFPDDIFENYRI